MDLTRANDLYSADIDYMNNYLKSLPDYSKINQKQYEGSSTVRLREHPTPKPFYNAVADYNSRNSHKSSVQIQQSPKTQRKHINPLSKSNSIHTFSKRNIGQSIEKETLANEQKSKISRSTSSTTIPAKETNDLMGFMKKPSSLMNIFKKLGSQNPPSTAQQAKNSSNNNNVRRNVHDVSKTPSVSRSKNIGDFWNENLQQQNTSNKKFGWNYQKIIPQKHQVNDMQKHVPQSPLAAKKIESTEPSRPSVSKKIDIPSPPQHHQHHHQHHQQQHQPQPQHQPHQQHHTHSQPYLKSQSQSLINFTKKMTESPKLQRSARAMKEDSDHERKLLKSSSNSHIYMNQDDPNYFKNLHKITKSLDNATNNIISNNKSSYKRSISNTSVPGFLGSSPQQNQFYYPTNQPHVMMVHPSSAPISFYPPISYKPPQDFHVPQRSGSKSNIPMCYKHPLNKSSSNTSMMTNFNGNGIGFYGVQDPLLWQATPSLHHINKSSSSSCIYAKTLSQPTHLSKNNDIFAKYKPIMSDDEESESEDDDTSKHSQFSKASCTSINKVPAPPPFRKQSLNNNNLPPPFTKLNSILIPINGQLPSAFKSNHHHHHHHHHNNVNQRKSLIEANYEQNLMDIYNVSPRVSRKNSRTSSITINPNNCKPLQQMTSPSSPVIKNACNPSNIFYNFMNPMAATQAQSISQMHLQQQQNESVGCYTPYTKYLSDRKYFDVAMNDGMNVVSGVKPEQRRISKIPTLSEQHQQQQQQQPQKQKPANNIVEPKVTETCVDIRGDEENNVNVDMNKTSTELVPAASKDDLTVATIANTSIETVIVDPKEILSAFDPYFIEDFTPEPSTSNKLHQLLTTVANEWNTGCDLARIVTTPPAVMNECKTYQDDHYDGSFQNEVVEVIKTAFLIKTLTALPLLVLIELMLANSINSHLILKPLLLFFYRF